MAFYPSLGEAIVSFGIIDVTEETAYVKIEQILV